MNPQPELQSDALRSEINTTRERMDETIDALGNRLQGRHLLDEVIGFFRGRREDDGSPALGGRLAHSAETAVHSVVNTVKTHPVPALMIGAGLAFLVYEARARRRRGEATEDDAATADYLEDSATGYSAEYEASGDMPADEAAGSGGKMSELAAGAKGKLSQLGDQASEQAATLRERGREKLEAARDKLGQLTSEVQHRGHELYATARQRVVTTTDQHPLEVALGCLAAGVIIGLALPTPTVVNRRLGPRVDQLRERTRAAGTELVEKGKRVVQAAAHAAKVEAKTQGLSVANLRGQTGNEPPAAGGAAPGSAATSEAMTPGATATPPAV